MKDIKLRGVGYLIMFAVVAFMGLLSFKSELAASVAFVEMPDKGCWDTVCAVEVVDQRFDFAYAGRDEKYPNKGYDNDGFSLRGYMSNNEMSGKHIKDAAMLQRFRLRKAQVQKDYIDSMSKKAVEMGVKYDIPPSIIVAQAMLESNYGTSRLAVLGNNHFGVQYRGKKRGMVGPIKANDLDVNHKSRTYKFAHYETTWWSLYHHAALLNGKYKKRLIDADIPMRERWMAALCGCSDSRMLAEDTKKSFCYAGACQWKAKDGKTSKYVATLKFVIRLYNLDKLDEVWEQQKRG